VSYRSPRGGLPSVVGRLIRRDGPRCRARGRLARLTVFRPSGWMAPVIRNGLSQVVVAFDSSRRRTLAARFRTLSPVAGGPCGTRIAVAMDRILRTFGRNASAGSLGVFVVAHHLPPPESSSARLGADAPRSGSPLIAGRVVVLDGGRVGDGPLSARRKRALLLAGRLFRRITQLFRRPTSVTRELAVHHPQ